MPTSATFDELYARLNPRQREAVDGIDGPVMVIAGPGTGKTNILTLRIANILAKTDTPPEAILALTFTESGAAEMKSRLRDIIGTDAYRVTITTFHAFCNRVIQEHPEAFGALAGATAITEADQAVLVQELIDTTDGLELLRPANAPDLYLKAVIGSINTLKREGVPPENVRTMADADDAVVLASDDLHHAKGAYKGTMKGAYQDRLKQNTKLRELAVLYSAYQESIRAQRVYDYSDMVMEVARALAADEPLRLMLQERHQYMLVDEHQDTNNAQNKVIELLASFWERPNLFVVGDAKQAIYRFQGASLENFLYFKSLYKDVRLVELEQNYRSSQLILDAAEGIRANAGAPLKASAGHEDTPIRLLSLSTPDVEQWAVARHIAARIAGGVPPEQIAVLGRDNADVLSMAGYLARLSIPHTTSTQQELTADPFIFQLLTIIDAVRDFGSPGPLLAALHAPVLDVDPLDVYKLAQFCRSGRNPYDVMRSPALLHESGIDSAERMRTLAGQFGSWARLATQPLAGSTLEAIVSESGLLAAVIASPDAPDTLARLHTLYDSLRNRIRREREYTLAQFAAHLAFLRTRGIMLSTSSGLPMPGRVRVMTAHKSKGLEFDYAYIINAVDGHWGSRTRRQLIRLPSMEPGGDDEERNLFYVALTRARREVVISGSDRDEGGAEQLPAQFIADIRPELTTRIDPLPLEKDWTTHGAVRFSAPPAELPRANDRAFIGELFRHQGLSVTALNNYLTCPWRYFYTNLIRIPEPPAFALMFGNAVDRALEEYFNRYAEGTAGSQGDLVGLFEDFLQQQPLQLRELQTALSRGRTALAGYFDRYHTTWHPNIINQLRIPAVELPDGTLLNGKIDKVERMDASGTVRVIDYKTGKPKSRNHIIGAVKDGDGNYLRQLTFYKLLLDRWQNGIYRMHEGVIDFVEPDAKGRWHREVFDISPEAVSSLENDVIRVAEEIRTLAFWERRCDDRTCPYCALRSLMKV